MLLKLITVFVLSASLAVLSGIHIRGDTMTEVHSCRSTENSCYTNDKDECLKSTGIKSLGQQANCVWEAGTCNTGTTRCDFRLPVKQCPLKCNLNSTADICHDNTEVGDFCYQYNSKDRCNSQYLTNDLGEQKNCVWGETGCIEEKYNCRLNNADPCPSKCNLRT